MNSLYRRAVIGLLAIALLSPLAAPATRAQGRTAGGGGAAPAAQQPQQQNPKTEQVWFDRARNLYARGQYDEAILILTDFLKTYPDSMITDLALVWLARSYMQQGRLADAEATGNLLKKIEGSPFIAIYESDMQAARQRQQSRAQSSPSASPSPAPSPTPAAAAHASASTERIEPNATPSPAPPANRATDSQQAHEYGQLSRQQSAPAAAPKKRSSHRNESPATPVLVPETQPQVTYSPVRPETSAATSPTVQPATPGTAPDEARSAAARETAPPQPGAFSLTIKQVANLTLALARSSEITQPGQVVQIPLTVTNTGNKPDRFRLQTDLPAEYQPSFSLDQGSTMSTLPILVTPELARGASASITLVMHVPPAATDGQTQSFQVRATSQSDLQVTRLASATVTVHSAALMATTATEGASTALPGSTFTQTITVTNNGNSTARDAQAEFIFSPEYELVSSDPAPASYDRQSRTAVWLVGNLEAGKSRKIQATVRVTTEALAQTNQLGRGSLRTPSIPLPSNFSSPQFTIGRVNRVAIEAPSTWLSATPGDTIYLPLVVRNPGNTPDSYQLRVVAPSAPASTLYADTNGDGRHQENEPAISETETIAGQGGQYRMLLAVKIPTDAATGQQYSYSFVALSKSSPTIASEAATILAVSAPHLRIRTEQITQQAAPGDTIYYRLILINDGSGLARKIVVTEVIAGGLEFVSADPHVKFDNGTLTWRVEELAPNNTAVLLITARVKPDLQADSTLPARHAAVYQDTNDNTYHAQ